MRRLLSAILFIGLLISCQESDEVPRSDQRDPVKEVDDLLSKADNERHSSPEKAIEYASEALQISNNIQYVHGAKRSHSLLAGLYSMYLSDSEKAQYHSEKFRIAASRLKSRKDLSAYHYNHGLLLLKEKKHAEALLHFTESLDLLEHGHDENKRGDALYHIGLICKRTGWPEKGLYYLDKVDTDVIDNVLAYNILNIKGHLHYELENYAEALSSFEAGLAKARQSADKKRSATITLDMSLPLIKLKRYEEAEKAISTSQALAIIAEDKDLLGQGYQKRVFLYEKQEAYGKALEANQLAEQTFLATNNTGRLAMVQLDYSNLHYKLGTYATAHQEGIKGLELEEMANWVRIGLYNNLSQIDSALGDMTGYYMYRSMRFELEQEQAALSEKLQVHEAELSYRTNQEEQAHQERIKQHEADRLALQNERIGLLTGAGIIVLVALLFLSTLRPLRRYENRMQEASALFRGFMEEVNRRLKGNNPVFPLSTTPHAPPPGPDERNIRKGPGPAPGQDGSSGS